MRLCLVENHDAVQRALALAEHDLAAAGSLLARYAIVEERGEVSAKMSDALLLAGTRARRRR